MTWSLGRGNPDAVLATNIAGRRPQGIAVRVDGEPMPLLPAIARQVHEVDPSAPLADIATLDQRLAEAMRAALLATLSALALTLAAIGAYGVTSFVVSRRRREYGIRLALGERPGSILWRA